MNSNTLVVDGQRFAVPTTDAYNPVGFGQQMQMQPIRQLGIPPMAGTGGGSGALGTDVVGGYGTAGNNAMATVRANLNPWSMRESPVLWAVLGLVVSIIGLSVIHWRKTTLAGGEANLHVGGAQAGAEGSV